MKAIHAVLLVSVLGGCTSVRLVQRDGCWVRQTSKWPNRVTEEIGPCAPPQTEWSDDRLTRVVQECIARTDYHWQTRALIAWNKGEQLPERASESSVLQECMNETSRALAGDNERLKQQNELLSSRLGEVGTERDTLRTRAEDANAKLLATHERISERLFTTQEKLGDRVLAEQEKLAEYLGEAAKKSSQPAVATATSTSNSDGAVTTDSNATAPAVPASVVTNMAVPAPGTPSTQAVAATTPAPAAAAPSTATAPGTCIVDGPAARPARQARTGKKSALRVKAAACPPAADAARAAASDMPRAAPDSTHAAAAGKTADGAGATQAAPGSADR